MCHVEFIQYNDYLVISATVNGGKAERNLMILLFAKNLNGARIHEDLYEVFLKTKRDMTEQSSDQVA